MSARGPQRVVWSEGLLMAPQHLQQLDIYHERLLSQRLDAVSSLCWGVHAVEFDQRALRTGQVLLTRFRGVLPDGAVLDLETGESHRVPALSQRPGSAGEALGRSVVDGWGRRLARRAASTRLALHPLDLDNPALVESNLAVIDQLLETGAKARTYRDFVIAHRPAAASRAA